MERSLRHRAASLANSILRRADIAVARRSELDSYRRRYAASIETGPALRLPLPEGATEILTADHPRLRELTARYARIHHEGAVHSQWANLVDGSSALPYIRSDNPYLWQARDRNEEIHYVLTAYYLKAIDGLSLLGRLDEDGAFGATVIPFEGGLVSRDLLDSIAEITFLEETLGLSGRQALTVLDIGAGYGRFAHRLVESLANLQRVFCTDAVATSTFVSEYYLRFRGVADRATVVPLDELGTSLSGKTIDLAVNIHSFSECRRASICWWLDLVASKDVRHLFIVPNAGLLRAGDELLSSETDGDPKDFLPDILARGYRLVTKRPKYRDPLVQKYGISPTHYFLFERA